MMRWLRPPSAAVAWIVVSRAMGACSDFVATEDPSSDVASNDTDPMDADAALPVDTIVDAPDGTGPDETSVDGGFACGNGVCDAEETCSSCPADCGFLLRRYGPPCVSAGAAPACDPGYVCVPRNKSAGGDVCVADFATWPPIADAHPVSDFVEASDSVLDQRTGLSWAKAALPPMAANLALSACTTQTFDGENDWRLPTYAELDSLVDRSRQKPASAAPHLLWPDNPAPNPYWTATPDAVSTKAFQELYTYQVAFADGSGGAVGVDWPAGVPFLRPVRCVRTHAAATSPDGTGTRFAKSSDGLTVLDRITGLRWQWYYSADKLPWTDAISWCSHNTAGMPGTGWRLPTVGESVQLQLRGAVAPLIDPAFAAVAEGFWTASPSLQGSHAWVVLLQSGAAGTNWQVKPLRVRCVR